MGLIRRKLKADTAARYDLLAKKAQVRAEPNILLLSVMTVLWLMVPPALRKVSPKMARKQIGAITLLKAKKYWILETLVRQK